MRARNSSDRFLPRHLRKDRAPATTDRPRRCRRRRDSRRSRCRGWRALRASAPASAADSRNAAALQRVAGDGRIELCDQVGGRRAVDGTPLKGAQPVGGFGVAGLAQQPRQQAERAGHALTQAFAVLGGQARFAGEADEIAAQDQQFGGEALRLRRGGGRRRSGHDRDGENHRGHDGADQNIMAQARHAGLLSIRHVHSFTETANVSKFLFCRVSGRRTGSHFAWKRSSSP